MTTTNNHLRVKRHGLEIVLGTPRQVAGTTGLLPLIQRTVGWVASQGLPMLTRVLLFFSLIRNSSAAECDIQQLPLEFSGSVIVGFIHLFLYFIVYLVAFVAIPFAFLLSFMYFSYCFFPPYFRKICLYLWLGHVDDLRVRIYDHIKRRVDYKIDYMVRHHVMITENQIDLMNMLSLYFRVKNFKGLIDRRYPPGFIDDIIQFLSNEAEIVIWDDDEIIDTPTKEQIRWYLRTRESNISYSKIPKKYVPEVKLKDYTNNYYYKFLRKLLLVQGIEPNPGMYRQYASILEDIHRHPPRPLGSFLNNAYSLVKRKLLNMAGIESNPGPTVQSKIAEVNKSVTVTIGQLRKVIRDLEELQALMAIESSPSVKEIRIPMASAPDGSGPKELVLPVIPAAGCTQEMYDRIMKALVSDASSIIEEAESTGTSESVAELKEALAGVTKPQMMGYLTPSVNVGMDNPTKEFLSGALRSVQELASSIPPFPTTVKLEHEVSLPQIDKVLSMLGLPKMDSPFAKIIAIIAVAGINYASYKSSMSPWAKLIVATLTTGAALWFISDLKFYEMLMDLKTLIPYQEVPVENDAQSYDLLGRDGVVAVLCGALYYSVFNKDAPTGLAMEFVKRTSDLTRLKSGLETGFDLVMSVAYKFLSFVGEMTDTESLKHLGIKDQKLVQLATRLNALIAEMNRTNEHGFDNHDALIALDGEIRAYMTSLTDLKANAHEITMCRDLLRTIQQLLPLFVCGDKLGARQEPLGVCLHGRTEQGKSVLLPNFISSIMARICTDQQWDRYDRDPVGCTYYLQGEKNFNEGLDSSKLVIVVDELAQLRDSASNPSPEVFTIFRANNSNPWLADMGALQLKGMVAARNLLTIATTNEDKWNIPSIIEPKAYARRWPCEYWVVIQKRYATAESLKLDDSSYNSFKNRVPDWSKVMPDEDGFPALDFCEFIPYDGLLGERKKGTSFNYDQVIDEIDRVYHKKKIFSDGNLKSHVSFRKKLGEQRKQGVFVPVCKPQAGDDGLPPLLPPDDSCYDQFEIEEFCRCLALPADIVSAAICPFPAKRELLYWDQCIMIREAYMEKRVRPLTTKIATFLQGTIDFITKHSVISGLLVGLTAATLVWYFVKPSIITEPQAYHAKQVHAKHANKSVPRTALPKWTIHPPLIDAQASCISQNTHDICRVVDRKSKFIVTLRNQLDDDTLTHADEQSVQVGPVFGGALFFGGRVAVMPSHYRDRILSDRGALPSFADLYPNLVVRFTRDTGTPNPWFFEVLWRELNEDNGHKNFLWTGCNEDQMFVRLPVACPRMKNILDFIPSEKEPFWDGNFNGALMRKNPSGGYDLEGSIMGVTKNVAYADYIGIKMITYPINTLHGECGSPVFVTDTRVKKPWLCGIHAAGDSVHLGHALPLVKEDLEFALRYFDEAPTEELDVHGGSDEPIVPTLPQGGFVHYTSCLGPALPISQASRTGITTAPLHGIMGEVQTAPARLTPGILDGTFVSPLEKSISKNCNPRLAFNSKLLRQATLQVGKKIYSVMANDDPGPEPCVWDQFHAIEGDMEFNPITRSTSAGYPWNLNFHRKKKRDFLGHDDYDYSSRACVELFKVLADKREKLKKGIDPGFVFVTNIKDETRPKHKVASFSSRTTEAEPIDLTILTREYFGDWMKYMHKTKIKHGVLVGINPYSQDWSVLAKMLLSYGNRMIAGDHSAWDGNFPAVLWFELLEIIEMYYWNSTAEERLVRRTIIEVLANTKHLVVTRDDWWKLVNEDAFRQAADEDQKVLVEEFLADIKLPATLKTDYFDEEQAKSDYVKAFLRCLRPGKLKAYIIEWFGSLTSGGTLTSQAGSVGNQIISRYAGYDHYLKSKGGHLSYQKWSDVPFDEIEKDNGFFTFGDDNVISVGPKKFFTFEDLKRSFTHYKMNYTNTKKTADSHDYEKIEEIDLLQRGFAYDSERGVWLSPLAEVSIEEMVNWIRNSARPGDYERNLRSAIKEYSQYPYPKFHEKVELKLKPAAASRLNLRFPELTWENARDELTHTDAFYQ